MFQNSLQDHIAGDVIGHGFIGEYQPVPHDIKGHIHYVLRQDVAPPADKSQPGVLQVGVTNMENSAINYRLTVEEGGKVLEQFPSIQLQPGKTWTSQINLSKAGTGSAPVTANLYRVDDPSKIYRTATWWPSSS